MTRLSAANQYWNQVLGGGTGDAGKRRLVQQYAGSLPVTPEALETASAGLGTTGRQRFMATLLGTAGAFGGRRGTGTGTGSRTPHFGALTGDRSQIEFTDHGTGETQVVDEPSPGDRKELAQRQAMQQEQIDGQLIDTFGAILQGEYQRQPAAFAEVYRPAITAIASGQMPTAENDAIIMARRRKEGSQRAALADYLSQNAASLSETDVQDIWTQHHQQYPEFAEGQQPPMTREEQLAVKRDQEETDFRTMMDAFTEANGLPNIPIRRNEKGVLEPAVNVESMISNQRQATAVSESATRQAASSKFQGQMKVWRAKAPRLRAGALPAEVASHNTALQTHIAEGQAIYDAYEAELNGAVAAPTIQPPPVEPAVAPVPILDGAAIRISTEDELAEALAQRRYDGGTVLEFVDGGTVFRARVNPDRSTVTVVEE